MAWSDPPYILPVRLATGCTVAVLDISVTRKISHVKCEQDYKNETFGDYKIFNFLANAKRYFSS